MESFEATIRQISIQGRPTKGDEGNSVKKKMRGTTKIAGNRNEEADRSLMDPYKLSTSRQCRSLQNKLVY